MKKTYTKKEVVGILRELRSAIIAEMNDEISFRKQLIQEEKWTELLTSDTTTYVLSYVAGDVLGRKINEVQKA